MVHIFVEDKNDNLPQFKSEQFFIGIPYDAKIGDIILDAEAHDPGIISYRFLTTETNLKALHLFLCFLTQTY